MKTEITAEQKRLVQESFEQVRPMAAVVASIFYDRLFELDDSLRLLFKGDMQEQGRKLMQIIGVAVKGLDWPQGLLPAVEALGARHTVYGVKARHYETVGAALLWTLEKGLGAGFTVEVRDAWLAVYTMLAEAMKSVVVAG